MSVLLNQEGWFWFKSFYIYDMRQYRRHSNAGQLCWCDTSRFKMLCYTRAVEGRRCVDSWQAEAMMTISSTGARGVITEDPGKAARVLRFFLIPVYWFARKTG